MTLLQEVAEEVGVSAMPTFLIFKNGQKVKTFVGGDAAKLEKAIAEAM